MDKFKRSFVLVSELYKNAESIIDTIQTVSGCVRFKRSQQTLMFIHLVDGSHADPFQLVLDSTKTKLKEEIEGKLNVGDSVRVIGKIIKSPAKGQLIEMEVIEFQIIGKISDPMTYLPATKGVPLETMRTFQYLRPKFLSFQSMMRIRSELSFAVHKFMHDRGILHLDPNTITMSDCEGAGEVFTITALMKTGKITDVACKEVEIDKTKIKTDEIDFSKDFFLKQAFLTVSSQLPLEALASGFRGGVYTTNPSYRAEPSKTRRHVCSFTHLEWELSISTLKELMDFSEDVVRNAIDSVIKNCPSDITSLEKFVSPNLLNVLKSLIKDDFARITYDEAVEIIDKDWKDIQKKYPKETFPKPNWGDDLGSYCERYIAENVFGKPVFVFKYPMELKSFYMKQCDPYEYTHKDGTKEIRRVVDSCDLLVPGIGELIGSSLREDNYDKLKHRMTVLGMDLSRYEWYLDLRKDATFPHGGAGLGFDRLVTLCTSVNGEGNIRDAIPFPVAFQECSM